MADIKESARARRGPAPRAETKQSEKQKNLLQASMNRGVQRALGEGERAGGRATGGSAVVVVQPTPEFDVVFGFVGFLDETPVERKCVRKPWPTRAHGRCASPLL